MKTNKLFQLILILLVAVSLTTSGWAKSPKTPADLGWPRQFKQGDKQVTVYQPQVDSWDGFTNIRFRCAIAVKTGPKKKELYGVAEVSADTVVDKTKRIVVTSNHRREIRFPNLPKGEAAELKRVVDQVMPVKKSITISLDRVLPYLEQDNKITQRTVDVNIQPPKIFYSRQPAILVMFMGNPQFKPVEKGSSLLFAINTNWDIFYDTTASRYYLLKEESWLTSDDPVKGSWTPANELPAKLLQLPKDDNWADVRKNIPGKPVKQLPVVFVATEPSEVVVTNGEPAYTPIKGTKLLRVSNTDNTLFLHSGEGQYYLLVAGRWFRTNKLDGSWIAASKDLPSDFRDIPDDNPAAFVKTSVPGTRDAQDAVLLASVPKTTTVNKSNPPVVNVVYQGKPQFVVIEGTTVKYAVNTPSQVFVVNGTYYCCSQGVWFYASAADGPWLLATSVPSVIYTIPPSNPNYNVTYVTVQQATPTTVVYTQTSGYSGEFVAANGVLMFGMGMIVGAAIYDDHHDHYYYPPPYYYSYGCGAVYYPAYGGYYASARYYGPYGGAGGMAAYNPYTGTYSRGAYAYGPAGSAGAWQAYNPYTGGYAQGGRVNTAYGSAGRFYAEQGGKSVSGGYRSGQQGTVGGIKTSEGTGAVGWDTARGQGGAVKTKSGDVYAGRNGNVYKKDDSGQWQKYDNGNWNAVDRPSSTERPQAATTAERAAPTSRETGSRTTTAQPSISDRSSFDRGLERDASARSWGNQRASQFESSQRSGSSGRSGSFQGSGGGFGRSGGFGGGGRGGGGRGGGGRRR